MEDRTPKILLVDDDELSRRMMELVLSGEGYRFETASNGLEAVDAMKSQAFDIVLMDLQMPLMDGFEAARTIRDNEAENEHTPIVALTAMLFEDEIKRCLSAGMDECITKPINTDQLFRLIESYMNRSKNTVTLTKTQEEEKFDETTVLDIQGALPRFGKDVQVYREFLDEFIEGLPEKVNQFQKAFHSGDYQTLADSAHNLKGMSASMGARQLSHLSLILDQTSQTGDKLLIQQALDEIQENINNFASEAKKLLSEFAEGL